MLDRSRSSFLAAVAAAVLFVAPQAGRADEVKLEMHAPSNGDRVGVGGVGWLIDLELTFPTTLERTGFTGFQLTGPGVHSAAPPMPGTFSLGPDDRLPGLIVLVSTTIPGARSCQNIANLFNLTGVTDRSESSTELWDTWIVGAPNFGVGTVSAAYAAVAADHDGDGVYDDAPAVVPDADGNGVCDEKDLKAFGLASGVEKARFFIEP